MTRLIHDSFFDIDKLYSYYSWLDHLAINRYQLFTVVWNIFLILVPLALFYFLKKYWRRTGLRGPLEKAAAAILFFVWLLFIPNSAYIITDVRHLLDYCPPDSPDRVCAANAWMIMFFFTYSVLGWPAFYYLLKLMADLIKEIIGDFWGKLLVILAIPLTALGVLLGLLNRFNSLDAVLFPKELWRAAGVYFSDGVFFRDWVIFTMFFYLLYALGDLIFKRPKN